jgi:flagellar biosynthesis/type III secretory pathway protein FliH
MGHISTTTSEELGDRVVNQARLLQLFTEFGLEHAAADCGIENIRRPLAWASLHLWWDIGDLVAVQVKEDEALRAKIAKLAAQLKERSSDACPAEALEGQISAAHAAGFNEGAAAAREKNAEAQMALAEIEQVVQARVGRRLFGRGEEAHRVPEDAPRTSLLGRLVGRFLGRRAVSA